MLEPSTDPVVSCELEALLRPDCSMSRAAVEDLVIREAIAHAATRGGMLTGGAQLPLSTTLAPILTMLRVGESAGRGIEVSPDVPPTVFVYSLASQSRVDGMRMVLSDNIWR
jgi:hypothetical protein